MPYFTDKEVELYQGAVSICGFKIIKVGHLDAINFMLDSFTKRTS